MKSKESFKIQYGTFTTNESNYSPIDLFTIFINNTKSQNVERKGVQRIDFKFEFGEQSICSSSVIYIKDYEEEYAICSMVDCFVILIDLEDDETMKIIKEIITFITTYCPMEKRMYMLGLHKGNNKVKVTEEELTCLFDFNKLIYEYKNINVDDYSDVVNHLEDIYVDSVEELKDYDKHSRVAISIDNSNKNGEDKSCMIF